MGERKKIAFIVNPQSGNGSTGKEWPRIAAKARAVLGALDVALTEGPGHAAQLTREVLYGGAELVVSVGGDGTFNEVINGFMGEEGPLRPQAVLGYLPRGTGCDFIRSFPVPKDLETALEAMSKGSTRAIDLGRFSYLDHAGRPAIRFFHNVLSFGLGGEVDDRVNRASKRLGGFLSFIWATLISILTYDKKRIELTIDGHSMEEVTVWNVAVANGQFHGGGMWVAPGASVDDGLLQVTVIGDLSKLEVFRYLPKLYQGRIYEVPRVSKFVGTHIEARSGQEVLIDMDGEQPGRLPVVADLFPSALRIIHGN